MSLFIGCDMNLDYNGAADAKTLAPLNSLTVTYTVKDSNGATTTSGTLAYVAASSGNYSGVIDGSVAFLSGAVYTITIIATGGGYDDKRSWDEQAGYRGQAA